MITEYLVRHLPSWMPGGGFKREARKCQALVQAMIDIPFESVRDSVVSGTILLCHYFSQSLC